MKEILENYERLDGEFKVKRKEAEAKRDKKLERVQKLEIALERAKKALEKEEEKVYSIRPPSMYSDIIEPLAKKMSEHFGLRYELYGPFRTECETSIYLRRDLKVSICDQPTISLTLRPNWKENWLTYNTGRKIQKYPKGSYGDMSGLNDVYEPLPMEFEEILKLVRNDFETEEKKND